MKLAYEAYDRVGKRVRDTVEAADTHEATEQLRRQGLYVTVIRPAGAGAAAGVEGGVKPRTKGSMSGGKRLKCLSMFARQLYVLVSTGTPLTESLNSIERQTRDPRWKAVIVSLRERLEEGMSLSEAMNLSPGHFDPITRSLVAAGESSGKLPAMLDRIATITRKELHVRSSIIGAMVYPCLLINVALAVLMVLLMFVLPRFGGLFQDMDMPMPPTTAMLMALSAFLLSYWWSIPLMAAGIFFGVRAWVRTAAGKVFCDTAVLRLPQFGKIAQSFATARLIRMMGILLDSYLPLLEVLQLVRDSTSNVHYRKLLQKAEEAVTRGEPISSAFGDASLINPSVYEAIRSGEHSGQVGPLLLNVAGFLDEDNEVVIKSLTSIIEPLILIVLGALVGFVAMSMFMPLFDLTAMTAGG